MTPRPPTQDTPDFEKIVGLLEDGVYEHMETNKAFYGGDHWQGSDAWVGPRPRIDGSSEATITYNVIMREIEQAFDSQNAIKEVVDRHADALLGHEPNWSVVLKRALGKTTNAETGEEEDEQPSDEEAALIEEANHALTTWWDEKGCLTVLQEAVRTALLGERGCIRMFVPPGELDYTGDVPVLTEVTELEDALERIWVQHPDYEKAHVYRDPRTMRLISIYHYQDDQDEYIEVSYLEPKRVENRKMTTLRVMRKAGSQSTSMRMGVVVEPLGGEAPQVEERTVTIDLDGQLWMKEILLPLLITEQVRQNQKHMNKVLTVLGRNLDTAGFLERIIFNAQIPGHFEERDGLRVWMEDEDFQLGPGVTPIMQGTAYTDETGAAKMASPTVYTRDPVETKTFNDGSDIYYRGILKETRQMHAFISGDAITSGESRRQAMADFIISLAITKSRVDEAIRWMLTAALNLAASFLGQPDRYRGLRVESDVQIRPGPVMTEEMRFIIEQVNAFLMSPETAMVLLGREDPDAEMDRIRRYRQEQQALKAAEAQVALEGQLAVIEAEAKAAGQQPPAGGNTNGPRAVPGTRSAGGSAPRRDNR